MALTVSESCGVLVLVLCVVQGKGAGADSTQLVACVMTLGAFSRFKHRLQMAPPHSSVLQYTSVYMSSIVN